MHTGVSVPAVGYLRLHVKHHQRMESRLVHDCRVSRVGDEYCRLTAKSSEEYRVRDLRGATAKHWHAHLYLSGPQFAHCANHGP